MSDQTLNKEVGIDEVIAQASEELKKAHGNIHHVIRTIANGPQSPDTGAIPVGMMNDYLNRFLENEWELFATHYLGNNPHGFNILWVLVRKF